MIGFLQECLTTVWHGIEEGWWKTVEKIDNEVQPTAIKKYYGECCNVAFSKPQ